MDVRCSWRDIRRRASRHSRSKSRELSQPASRRCVVWGSYRWSVAVVPEGSHLYTTLAAQQEALPDVQYVAAAARAAATGRMAAAGATTGRMATSREAAVLVPPAASALR